MDFIHQRLYRFKNGDLFVSIIYMGYPGSGFFEPQYEMLIRGDGYDDEITTAKTPAPLLDKARRVLGDRFDQGEYTPDLPDVRT